MIIYKIMNNLNGKIYIGQTVRPLPKRVTHHICENKFPIAKALKKYGLDNFTITIIDYADTKEVLDQKEKYWITYCDCKSPNGYNLTDGGEGRRGYKCSEETKLKMKIAASKRIISPEEIKKRSEFMINRPVSAETRERISRANKNRIISAEQRIKISNSLMGRPKSEETKRKLSVANTGKIIPRDQREKISKSLIGRTHTVSKETGEKISIAKMGHSVSVETREKIGAKNRNPSKETINKMRLSRNKYLEQNGTTEPRKGIL
jgi:predicted GIY-YIG superfamily endonuclease